MSDLRYLFFVTKPYSFPVLKPIEDYLLSTGTGEVRWFLAGTTENYLPVSNRLHSSTEVAGYDPHVVLAPGNVVPHRWPGLKVQIFHGLGEEKPGHYRITGFFDLYCTPGPLVTQRFEARRRRKRHFLVRETGWPKLDSLAESIDIREAKSGLGLDPNRPLILYAPTFSPRYESASALLEPICSQAGSKYQWIVKFHDLMPANIRNSYQQRLGSAVLSAEHSDITPLLAAADVMITDTSSVAYEFLMLDRPIITYRAAARQDKGIDLQSPANLAEAIQRSLDDPAEFTLQRQEYLGQLHPYRDGQSARRVVQACEGIIANGEHLRLRRKPLNLWRRYQNRNLVR